MRSGLAEPAHRRTSGGRSRTVAAAPVVVFAALLATLCATVLAGCSSSEYVAPPATATRGDVDAAAASRTLAGLQTALGVGDAAAARRLGSGAGADLLAAVATNAGAIGLEDVTLRYVTETGRTDGDGGWDAVVALTWRITGLDRRSARAEVPFSFSEGGTAVSGIGGTGSGAAAGGRLPLWLTGPVRVERLTGGLVLTTDAGADLAAYVRWTRTALRSVRPVVGGDVGLVVEVPSDGAALDRALGVAPGSYDGIAAVTAPVDGERAPGTPVHVFINPDVFAGLDPTAAQVVVSHESVHALTSAPLSSSAPLWLVEGFADYVALRDVDLPPSRTARQVIAQVRADGAPKALPADTEFGTTSTHLGAIYEAAWQICVVLAERSGQQRLVDFYDAVLATGKVDQRLRADFGWSIADLTGAWRRQLTSLARVAG